MTPRVTITLAICVLGAAIAVVGLARQPQTAQPRATQDQAVPGETRAADGPSIAVVDFAFGGITAVAAGQPISVSNGDGVAHTLSAVDGSFDTGVIDGAGNGSFVAPAEAGTYAFICQIHPSMTGSLTVAP